MTWKQYMRQAQAAARRREREAAREYRAWEKEHKRLEKEAQRQAAADEVEGFDNYLQMLVTVHMGCSRDWEWHRVATAPPPPAPVHNPRNESAARSMLDSYVPGFFEKLFGGAKKRRAELEQLVVHGRNTDQQEFATAMSHYQAAHAYWTTSVRLAPGVQTLHPGACAEALAHAEAFDELEAFGAKVVLDSIVDRAASLRCVIDKPDVVPEQEMKLTSGGKVSEKSMAAGKYWSLYQDHICSCAIRVARETFAVLPVARAIVNTQVVRVNPTTGHMEPQTVLAVHFMRDTLRTLKLDAIDPSDSMKNFPHRMKFKKSAGLETVEPMTHDEQWVTT